MKKRVIDLVVVIMPILLLSQCAQTKEKNNKQEGITKMVKTSSGLEYEIIKEGTGATPSVGQTVTVHYTGWLDENGKPGRKFDSSVDRGQPFRFTIGVGQVIKGWDEGVLNMKVGEKRRLIIPANLGYGARGAGAVIPPNATLIFDVELIDTK
ncbi:MAG: FK506-binding protein [Candidatus Dependentiae bacterium ADurb.Bin331]|nr:MAG: FK506-binding protein [Candidatus Dependentiae bacterium ADurb.Bin331]